MLDSYRAWMTTASTSTFCPDSSHECLNAKLATCQDRTIQCLDPLPSPAGIVRKDVTDNTTLNSQSLSAKFSFKCLTPGELSKTSIALTLQQKGVEGFRIRHGNITIAMDWW